MVRPGLYLEMAAEAKTSVLTAGRVEAHPSAHQRILPIGPDDPRYAGGGMNCPQVRVIGPRSPLHRDTQVDGPLDEEVMQRGSPNAQSDAVGKLRLYRRPTFDESNAPKGIRLVQTYLDTQPAECRHGVRHQAFATSLIDGRPGVVGYGDPEAFLASSDGGGKPGRTAADNENIVSDCTLSNSYQRSSTNSEQKPGPIAARRL